MRDNVEDMVAYIDPCDPVAHKRASPKRPCDEISADAAAGGNLNDSKFGKTGVELRWYKYHEYKALNDNQKVELTAWKATQPAHAGKKRYSSKNSNQGGLNQGGSHVKGAFTPGYHKFKKVFRAQLTALEVASNAKEQN